MDMFCVLPLARRRQALSDVHQGMTATPQTWPFETGQVRRNGRSVHMNERQVSGRGRCRLNGRFWVLATAKPPSRERPTAYLRQPQYQAPSPAAAPKSMSGTLRPLIRERSRTSPPITWCPARQQKLPNDLSAHLFDLGCTIISVTYRRICGSVWKKQLKRRLRYSCSTGLSRAAWQRAQACGSAARASTTINGSSWQLHGGENLIPTVRGPSWAPKTRLTLSSTTAIARIIAATTCAAHRAAMLGIEAECTLFVPTHSGPARRACGTIHARPSRSGPPHTS